MTHVLGSLRSRVLTPSFCEATLEKRGFQVKDDASRELLERIGTTFLTGFSYAVGADSPRAAGAALDDVPTRFRGFAYEGAAMGFAVLDGLAPLRRDRFTRFADGIGRDHPYMAQVGLGWALARLPRFRWPKPSGEPLLHWLVLDGYGFHQAYFHTGRVVARRAEQPPVRWGEPGHAWYRPRALDQGVGRALWFAGGADPRRVAELIDRFAPHRRPDLYSGAGLAATYAGGATEAELAGFRGRAREYLPHVAQGCVFAAEARQRAGLEVEHTEIAAGVFCGLSARDAARLGAASRRPARV